MRLSSFVLSLNSKHCYCFHDMFKGITYTKSIEYTRVSNQFSPFVFVFIEVIRLLWLEYIVFSVRLGLVLKNYNKVDTKNITIELIRPNSDIRSAVEGISDDVISIQFLLQNEFDPFMAHSKLPQRSHIDVSLTMGWCNMVMFFRSKKFNSLMTFKTPAKIKLKSYLYFIFHD